jgi:hypothetical protein
MGPRRQSLNLDILLHLTANGKHTRNFWIAAQRHTRVIILVRTQEAEKLLQIPEEDTARYIEL